MSEAQQIASGNHDERVRRFVELLRRDNAMLERQVSVLREALATRALLDGPTVIRQGPVLDAIDRLERENAALRELLNEPYQFFRFGHKALFPWGKFLDGWCKRAEKLGFQKEAKP